MADIGDRPFAVVGENLHQNRHPARAVSFIGGFFIGDPGKFAGSLFDRPLDIVFGHVLRFGRGDGAPEPGVAPRIAAPRARRDGDLLDKLGEDLTPAGVGGPLLVLDGAPF